MVRMALARLTTMLTRRASVPEIQGTTEEIAREKCRRAAEILQGPCITEDTALCFEALNGLPGPYIKFFLKELGLDGGYPKTLYEHS